MVQHDNVTSVVNRVAGSVRDVEGTRREADDGRHRSRLALHRRAGQRTPEGDHPADLVLGIEFDDVPALVSMAFSFSGRFRVSVRTPWSRDWSNEVAVMEEIVQTPIGHLYLTR